MKTKSQIPNPKDITDKMEILYPEINDIYDKLIPNGPFLGKKDITIILNPSNPISYPSLLPNAYLIGLSKGGLIYDQLAYQYAHELCHIYSDPRINNWLIESFCECMSFVILEHLYDHWSKKASITGTEWYAINYKNYLQNSINSYLVQIEKNENEIKDLDIVDTLESLTSNIERKTNFILAYKIFLYYKEYPKVLHLIPYLHFTSFELNLTPNDLFQTVKPNTEGMDKNIPMDLRVHWNFITQQITQVA
jgi:hypothetical protein